MYEPESYEEPTVESKSKHVVGVQSSSDSWKLCGSLIKEQELCVSEIGEEYSGLRLVNPRAEKQMQVSLERYGQISPVVVNSVCQGGYELLDGFKRLRASRRISERGTLRARVMQVGVGAAKAAMLFLNWVSRSVSDLEEGWVVRALCREHGLTQVEVGQLLGRDRSWVSRRLSLVERLSEEVQAHLRLSLITGTVGRELARVPRGTQQRLLQTVTEHGLNSREVSALVRLIRESSATEQERYLQQPRQALAEQSKEQKGLQSDCRLGKQGNELMQHLLWMQRGCARVISTVGNHGLSRFRPEQLLILAPALGQAERAGRHASEVLREALGASTRVDNDDVQQS